MNTLKIVLSTCPPGQASALATWLLERRLAACVNIVPAIQSVYRWEGRIIQEQETLLIIKTLQDNCEELIRQLAAEHPYSVPEIISLASDAVLPAYLAWVQDEVTTAPAAAE